MNDPRRTDGFALIGAIVLIALLMALLTGYFALTRVELSTTDSTMRSFRGFYAAEAGLNVRAQQVRDRFEGFNRPSGTAPAATLPCTGGNVGSGDFACATYSFENRETTTYVEEPPTNPLSIVIPRGEPFQNLSAQEYQYKVSAVARGRRDAPEAVLEMHFKSRLVPLFQFAAFYNKDLEIMPGPSMTLAGPVHTNGDLYVGTYATLDVLGQVTAAGAFYRGYKNSNSCMAGAVNVKNPNVLAPLPPCSTGRRKYAESDLVPWNDQVLIGVNTLTVPDPGMLDPVGGGVYWDHADLRIVLDVGVSPATIKVYGASGTPDAGRSAVLSACASASYSTTFTNRREGTTIKMLNVDARDLLDCAYDFSLLDGGKHIDDTTEGGLVWYLGVKGPNQAGQNNYGVRVYDGANLSAPDAGSPAIRGLTIATNQALYIKGSYNTTNKKPAAFLADSINVLSGAQNDAASAGALSGRVATATTINAAFLAGTDTSGGAEGTAGQDTGGYNGGLENFPRFHEKWSGVNFTYRGSFVSLNRPLHVDGEWIYGPPYYEAPNRLWSYDTDFNDAAKLPPLSPRFVYLRQELFTRQFEL